LQKCPGTKERKLVAEVTRNRSKFDIVGIFDKGQASHERYIV